MINNVAMLPAADDGCGYYRLWLPHLRTPNSKWCPANREGLVAFNAFAGCNVAVVQRLASDKNYETIEIMKQMGMKIVFDLDDDMWSVQSSNPAKEQLKMFQNYERGFQDCAIACNLITVSTAKLKSAVENQIGKKIPVKVIGNAIDMAILQQSPIKRNDGKVVIGWGGSNTHLKDLATMGNALDIIIEENKEAHLHWIGMAPPGKHLQFHDRVNAHTWVPVKQFPVRLSTWNWDIGVAPLEDNRFNRSKSAIKMMELGALRKPCLASPVQPYLEFTSLDKRLEWLLCENEKEWILKLTCLIVDEDQRNYYGNLMYEVVKEYYNMELRSKIWGDAFNQAAASI